MSAAQTLQDQPATQQQVQQQQKQQRGAVEVQEDALMHLGADPAVYADDDTPKTPQRRALRRAPIDDLVDDGV
jgi:hypothetical protein